MYDSHIASASAGALNLSKELNNFVSVPEKGTLPEPEGKTTNSSSAATEGAAARAIALAVGLYMFKTSGMWCRGPVRMKAGVVGLSAGRPVSTKSAGRRHGVECSRKC